MAEEDAFVVVGSMVCLSLFSFQEAKMPFTSPAYQAACSYGSSTWRIQRRSEEQWFFPKGSKGKWGAVTREGPAVDQDPCPWRHIEWKVLRIELVPQLTDLWSRSGWAGSTRPVQVGFPQPEWPVRALTSAQVAHQGHTTKMRGVSAKMKGLQCHCLGFRWHWVWVQTDLQGLQVPHSGQGWQACRTSEVFQGNFLPIEAG